MAEALLYVTDRRTFEPVQLVETYSQFRYIKYWQKYGTAKLEIEGRYLSDRSLELLATGGFGLRVIRIYRDSAGKERQEEFTGYAVRWRYQEGQSVSIESDESQICNEAIILGGIPEGQELLPVNRIVKRYSADGYAGNAEGDELEDILMSRARYGTKERIFDARQIQKDKHFEDFKDLIFRQDARPRRTVKLTLGSEINYANGRFIIEFRDILGYTADRMVDTTGLADLALDEKEPAVKHAALLMNRELFQFGALDGHPTLALRFDEEYGAEEALKIKTRRYRDANLMISNYQAPDPMMPDKEIGPQGKLINFQWRWPRLSEAIQEVCEEGNIGITYEPRSQRDSEGALVRQYIIKFVEDRNRYSQFIDEKHNPDRVIISESWADREHGIQVGDRVALALRISNSPTVNSQLRLQSGLNPDGLGMLCAAKETTLRPGQRDKVTMSLNQKEIEASEVFEKLFARIRKEETS